MGKLAKALGLGHKGKIGLSVNKPSYYAGELIVGTIYVEVYEPIQCDALVLKASGKEKVSWKEEEMKDGKMEKEDYEFDHEFFKEKIVICSLPQVYAPGKYMYPFEYQLPPSLPGVFHLEKFNSGPVKGLKVDIKYKLKATLDVNGFFASDLKADCHLVVHPQPPMNISEPLMDSTVENVNFLCCISKGQCELAIRLDKSVFFPGETVNVACDVDNRSQVEISALNSYLHQDIHLTPKKGGHTRTFSRKLCMQSFPGVASASQSSHPLPMPLVTTEYGSNAMPPSTTGVMVRCSYRIEAECDIPWAPDVHLSIPVTIMAPAMPYLSWVPPSIDGYVQFNE